MLLEETRTKYNVTAMFQIQYNKHTMTMKHLPIRDIEVLKEASDEPRFSHIGEGFLEQQPHLLSNFLLRAFQQPQEITNIQVSHLHFITLKGQ